MNDEQEKRLIALINEARNKNATPANVHQIIAFVRDRCDESYSAGSEMAKELLRLRLGLATNSYITK